MSIAARLAEIRARIAASARRAGRDAAEVELVAVSKFQPVAALREAYDGGQRLFGENRVQEALEKKGLLADLMAGPDPLRIDIIGPVQSNKARKAVEAASRIQSIDGVDIGLRIARVAAEAGRVMPVLLQVDLAGEATKSGVPATETLDALTALSVAPGLRVEGLMAIPPFLEDPDLVRPYFRRLRELRDEAAGGGLLAGRHLSMGMSHDFEAAIEEGATLVRVGTAIFGPRPPRSAPGFSAESVHPA